MLRAPPADGAKDEGHVEESEDAEERAEQGAAIGLFDEGAKEEIGDVEEPEDERGGEARVPGPPDTPDGMSPDGSGDEHDGGEDEADFGGRDGEPIVFRGALPDVKKIGDEADEEGVHARPGAADVEIEDALDEAHGAFFGSDVEGRVGRSDDQKNRDGAEEYAFEHGGFIPPEDIRRKAIAPSKRRDRKWRGRQFPSIG